MTHDPTQHGGRTREQVARCWQACEVVWVPIIFFVLAVGSFEIGAWLVATVAGWM